MVSIVMPAYNAEKYIGEALDSVLAQTCSDWECIVVDDCSTDATADIVHDYASRDSRIRYHKLALNSGSAKVPRDTAVGMARGEWIIPLDSDDTLAPDVLEGLMRRQCETGADMVLLRMVYTAGGGGTGLQIPATDFDMTQVMSGRQALMMTIGQWQIALNGLVRKQLKERVLARADIGNHMNADEYGHRVELLNADKVAFANVCYFYNNNDASVTRAVKPTLFEPLITDWALVGLLAETFGNNSAEHRYSKVCFYTNLLKLHVIYYARLRRRFTPAQRTRSTELLRKHRKLGGPWYKFVVQAPAVAKEVLRRYKRHRK